MRIGEVVSDEVKQIGYHSSLPFLRDKLKGDRVWLQMERVDKGWNRRIASWVTKVAFEKVIRNYSQAQVVVFLLRDRHRQERVVVDSSALLQPLGSRTTHLLNLCESVNS